MSLHADIDPTNSASMAQPASTVKPKKEIPLPHLETRAEEWASSITHAIGVALAFAALVILVVLASKHGEARKIITLSIFGSSMLILYIASTVFHACHPERHKRLKRAFKIADHSAIYALIAGSYTPILLVFVRGAWGWSLFGVLWGMTLIGVCIKVYFVDKCEKLSTGIYLLMGWLGFIAAKTFWETVPHNALLWIAAGGLAYTFGVIFFFWDRLPYNHAIWHLFVMAGSACHFFAMLHYVVPHNT